MKKVFLPFLLLTCLVFAASSQTITYKVKSDNADPKPASLSLEPFYMDYWTGDLSMGYSVRADVTLLNRFQIKADFRRSYLDIFLNDKLDGRKRTWTEIGGALLFVNRTKDANIRVVLSSSTSYSGSYKTTYTKSISVPGTVRKQIGLRAGLLNISSPFSASRNTSNASGETPLYYTMKGDTTRKSVNVAQMNLIGTIHAGLDFNKIYDLIIYADGYGRRRAAMYSNFYIDGIFAPVIGLKTVDSALSNNPNYDGLHSDTYKRFGWRAGWIIRYPRSVFLAYKMEFGGMPGIKTGKWSNGYFVMTMGINIPMSIKALEKKK
ncbi:MAG: hypothetical protein SGJ10_12470 [Bacteroidota bacterium]|nr:hypothetical protein [Bacteroidota bacterium]